MTEVILVDIRLWVTYPAVLSRQKHEMMQENYERFGSFKKNSLFLLVTGL